MKENKLYPIEIVDGILQATPDIEEEIAAVDYGETISLSEFKAMFARWI